MSRAPTVLEALRDFYDPMSPQEFYFLANDGFVQFFSVMDFDISARRSLFEIPVPETSVRKYGDYLDELGLRHLRENIVRAGVYFESRLGLACVGLYFRSKGQALQAAYDAGAAFIRYCEAHPEVRKRVWRGFDDQNDPDREGPVFELVIQECHGSPNSFQMQRDIWVTIDATTGEVDHDTKLAGHPEDCFWAFVPSDSDGNPTRVGIRW